MGGLARGLYEHLITESLAEALGDLDSGRVAERKRLHPEEAADRLALHLATLVRQVVSCLDARRRTELGVGLARKVGELLATESKGVESSDLLTGTGDLLAGILARLPDGSPEALPSPATPLLDTTLLTKAPGSRESVFMKKLPKQEPGQALSNCRRSQRSPKHSSSNARGPAGTTRAQDMPTKKSREKNRLIMGTISRLTPDFGNGGVGYVLGVDQVEYFFHARNVTGITYASLQVGQRVALHPIPARAAMGAGPRATLIGRPELANQATRGKCAPTQQAALRPSLVQPYRPQ